MVFQKHKKLNGVDCERCVGVEPMVGLRSLILGAVQGCLGHSAEAKCSLRASLSARQHLPDTATDSHVSAFALYELAQLLIQEAAEVSILPCFYKQSVVTIN